MRPQAQMHPVRCNFGSEQTWRLIFVHRQEDKITGLPFLPLWLCDWTILLCRLLTNSDDMLSSQILSSESVRHLNYSISGRQKPTCPHSLNSSVSSLVFSDLKLSHYIRNSQSSVWALLDWMPTYLPAIRLRSVIHAQHNSQTWPIRSSLHFCNYSANILWKGHIPAVHLLLPLHRFLHPVSVLLV